MAKQVPQTNGRMNFSTPLAEALARPGRASLTFTDEALGEGRAVALDAYRARGFAPEGLAVIVLPGMERNSAEYRDFWAEAAERHNLLVLSLGFGREAFAGAEAYTQGGVLDAEGRLTQPAAWAYPVPLRLLADLRAAGLLAPAGRARLFGHSAGAQFAQRLLCALGPAPFEAIVAANAGWYCLPQLERPWPEGMGGIGLRPADVQRLLAAPLTLLLGEEDKRADSAALDHSPEAERQGPHRFARGEFFFRAGRAEAEARGLDCAWRIRGVPGIGHDGRAMSRACAALWFEGAIPPPAQLRAGGGRASP